MKQRSIFNPAKTQAILEASVAFSLVLLFTLGIIRIWGWSHKQLVENVRDYENTRVGFTQSLHWDMYETEELKDSWTMPLSAGK